MGIPLKTLSDWKQKGLIETDVDHRKRANATPKKNRRRAHRAHVLTDRYGYSQAEAAKKIGVSESTLSVYLKMHRTSTFCFSEIQ